MPPVSGLLHPTERRLALEKLIQHWQPENLAAVNALLAKHKTFAPSVEEISRYLDHARQALRGLPDSAGRQGLLALTDFLAQQTAALAVQ